MNAAFHVTAFRLALFTIIDDTLVRLTSLKGINIKCRTATLQRLSVHTTLWPGLAQWSNRLWNVTIPMYVESNYLVFHNRNSLPLGPILSFISFY